ncbi:MAG: efflux RND transporter periplasmic adaptor subunit [Comamonadaceae bacterium]|nr:MAG: efflux RND transporter periplasmic adaptor subunit [Comamonadaceae bacterium]
MTRRRLVWAVAMLVLLLLGLGGWRALKARSAAAPATGTTPAETVVSLAATDLAQARSVELVQALPVSGTLRAVDSAVVKARVAGELSGLTVREGDSVTRGQVVARVDASEYQSRLRQAQEQSDATRAQAEVAQRSFDNNKALVAQGFISRTALDTSQSNLNAALATHRAALAAVDVTRKSLDDTVLRSPIAGQVAQRLVQPGERVGVDTRVIEVVDLSRIEVEATLAAADSIAVRAGQRASFDIEGGGGTPAAAVGAPVDGATPTASVAAAERRVGATVARVNPSAQAGSRSVLVYLRLDRSEGFRQGLFAQGSIEVDRVRVLALPLAAVRVDKPSPYVQAVVDGRIVHRPVSLGRRGLVGSTAMVEVGGVAEGALVAGASIGLLREGTAVRLPPTAAAPGPVPGTSPAAAAASAPARAVAP